MSALDGDWSNSRSESQPGHCEEKETLYPCWKMSPTSSSVHNQPGHFIDQLIPALNTDLLHVPFCRQNCGFVRNSDKAVWDYKVAHSENLRPRWLTTCFETWMAKEQTFLEESILGKPALLQILTLEFAVDFSQLFLLGKADRPLFVANNRCTPILNWQGWSAVVFYSCDVTQLFFVMFSVARAMRKLHFRFVINETSK